MEHKEKMVEKKSKLKYKNIVAFGVSYLETGSAKYL